MSDVEIWSPDPEAIVAAAPTEWTPDPSWFHEVPEWLDATWEDGVVQLGPDDEVTRVAALVAPYGECILDGGRNGQACFTPPISPTDYEYAHVGALRTADGSIARVANIGGGVPHYDPNKPLDMSPAVHHYANTASRVMVGRYYDRPDLGGIIFLGATWPGVDPQVARSAPLSGDWRWVDSMQDWDFAGAQQVLNSGFRPNRHNRRRASTVGRHSLLAPALSNMEFAMVASLGPSGDEHMLGAWVPSDDGNVLAPATLIDLAELSAIVASLEDELAVLIEDSTPLLPFYDQPTEAIVASARKRRKKRSDAWLATHPNPKSTPRDIVGKHGHRPHGPSILSPRIYEHLRAKGYSKAKAAAISNAMFNKRRGKPPKSVKGTKGLVGVGKVASLGTPVDLGDATIDGEPMTKGNIILVPDNPDALTVPGGDPADVLHATLKFLGDLDPWDDEQRERAEGIVGEWARTHGPFTANVAGVGELGDDGAVVYHFDGDDLQAARADLSAAIDDGTAPDTTDTYPSFKPHVTAGYGIDAPPVPAEPITFSRARVQWADEALEWPLGQPVEAPVAAARPRKRIRQAQSLLDSPDVGDDWRHDWHDPNTGEFAPLGYVSPQVLRKLLSDNPTLRREAELAIRTKFDSPKAQPWVRAFQNATPTKRGKIARNARREIIGDRPDGTTADDRKAQVAWDRASDVVARGLARGTGGEDRMVDVPDALDDGRPRPVGITPSGAQVFRDEDFTRLRPRELRPGDLIGNAERDDGLETVEVTGVRTDGGRTFVDVGTSEVPYARDDIVKVLRRPDELTAAEARKPKPVNPDQGGLFDAPDDDPIPAPSEPDSIPPMSNTTTAEPDAPAAPEPDVDPVDELDAPEGPDADPADIPERPAISWVGSDGIAMPGDGNALQLLTAAKKRRREVYEALLAEHADAEAATPEGPKRDALIEQNEVIAQSWRKANPEPTMAHATAAIAAGEDRQDPVPDDTPNVDEPVTPLTDGTRNGAAPPKPEGVTRVSRKVHAVAASAIRARVAELNKRIAKKGLGEPVTVHVGEPYLERDERGVEAYWADVDIDVAEPPRLPGGWKLATVADWSATDVPLVHNVGADEDGEGGLGLTADDMDRMRCDHCNSRRQRNRVFALEAEDGKVVHVGSTCIADFLGHDVGSLLWFPQAMDEIEDDDFYGGGGGKYGVPTEVFIANAHAAVQSFGWSKSDSQHPTRSTTTSLLFPTRYDQEDEGMVEAMNLAKDEATLQYARDAIEWAKNMTPKDDFERNLQAVASSEDLGPKAWGIAAYLPVAYGRHLDAEYQKRQRDEKPPPEAPVPEGKQTVEGTIISLSWRDNAYGDSVLKMTVADDRGFRVWTTAPAAIRDDVKRGDRVKFNASLTRSDDDETFGFGKRPTKAEILPSETDGDPADDDIAEAETELGLDPGPDEAPDAVWSKPPADWRPTSPQRPLDADELRDLARGYNLDYLDEAGPLIDGGTPTIRVTSQRGGTDLRVAYGVVGGNGDWIDGGAPAVMKVRPPRDANTPEGNAAWREDIGRKWAGEGVNVDLGDSPIVATESRGARPGAGQGGLFDDPDLFGDEPDTPGDATPETDGGIESLSDTDLATVKAAAIEWVNVTPEPDAMRQLADVLDEEARRAELAGDTDRAAKLRANAAKWRKSAGDVDAPDPEPTPEPEAEVDVPLDSGSGGDLASVDDETLDRLITENGRAASRIGAGAYAVEYVANALDERAHRYEQAGQPAAASADRTLARKLREKLQAREAAEQASEEAARNVPTLEAILGSSTFDSGRTLELGRLVNGNPDAALGDTASRVSLGAITTAIRTLDGDLAPVEPGDRFSADSTTAAVGLALLRGARVSTIPNGIAIELSDGQAGTGGSGRYLLIRDSVGGQKLEAYDADGRRTFSGERLPFAHFTGILQPRPTGNMPDGARNAIDSARADVANPDVNTLDVLAGHRDAFVASLSTVAPPEEWHQHPGIVAAVTEFGDVLRDAVAETEAGIDLDMSAGLTEDAAAASKSFDLADTLVEFADRLASDGGGFDPQDLDGHATIAEFLKATDGEFVSFADSGKLSDGSTRQSIRFAYTHESGERRTMDVDIMGADWNPDDPTMGVSIYRRGGGGHRSRDVRLRGDDVRKADLKQLRSHVRATRALNRDQKRSAALGKADEVNASGTTQRRNAQAAAAVLASLGVERGLDDATADTIQVGSGTGVITRRKTVNREGLTTALGRSRTVKATPAKKRGAASDADLLTVGMAQYPTSWIESLGDHTFLIARRGDADSGYNVDMSRWTSAGAPNGSYLSIPGKGDVGANVIVHEVGHTMEHKVPGLREFVIAHLDTLHAGSDPAKALPGYRSTRGYEDDIKRVYTRRVYVGNGGDPHGTWASVRSKITSTEYLTTGMETLVPEGGSNEDDFYGIDPVHDAFILGVVATFDPNAVPVAGTVVAP